MRLSRDISREDYMKSMNWKLVLYPITFVLSILAGFWGASGSYLYHEFLRDIALQKANIMMLHYQKPLTTQLFNAAEFLVAFIVPCGLVWLVYFLITRRLTTRARVSKLSHSKENMTS